MPIHIRDKTTTTRQWYPPSATAANTGYAFGNVQLLRVTLSPIPGNTTAMNVVLSDAHREFAAFELHNGLAIAPDGCLGLTVDVGSRVLSTPCPKLRLGELGNDVVGIDTEGNDRGAIEWPCGRVSFDFVVVKDRDAFLAFMRDGPPDRTLLSLLLKYSHTSFQLAQRRCDARPDQAGISPPTSRANRSP